MAKVDVEVVVIEWLNSLGGSYQAHGDKPSSAPDQYILVDRTGGPRESMVLDKAEILIEVYDKNSRNDAKNKALDIADRVIELVNYDENITRAKVNSMVNLDDLLGQFHRYQIYVDVWGARNT